MLAREDEPGYTRLVGYVVAWEGAPRTAEVLRQPLKGLCPTIWCRVPVWRFRPGRWTENGKFDRRALPAPEQSAFSTATMKHRGVRWRRSWRGSGRTAKGRAGRATRQLL